METKSCIKCQLLKPLTSFYKNRKGTLTTCKECCSKYQMNYSKKRKKYHLKYKKKYGLGVGTIGRYGLKLALEVYGRAGRKCQKCGEVNDLTIHHLDNNGRNNFERKLPVNNDIQNLVVLCRRCHGSIHGKESKGIKRNYSIKNCILCKNSYIPLVNRQKYCKKCQNGKFYLKKMHKKL